MRETILGAEARLLGRAHITWGLKGLVKCLSLSPLSCGKLIKGRKKIPFSPSLNLALSCGNQQSGFLRTTAFKSPLVSCP